MEIIRTTPYSPLRTRPRSQRVTFEKGLSRADSSAEPVNSAKAGVAAEHFNLDEVTAQLEEAGETLENDPTLSNFLSFKDSMGNFARTATSLAYCFDKIFSPRQRSHVITRVIDKEADQLYGKTMNSQRGNIRLAGEIDDIRGMILNNSI
jgi:uncharacterized protein YaaR (DUF327 family)